MRKLCSFLVLSLAVFTFTTNLVFAENLAAIKPNFKQLAKLEECVEVKDTESPCATLELSLDFTAIEWLDAFLLKQLNLANPSSLNPLPTKVNSWVESLQNQAASWLAGAVEEIKADVEGEFALALGREYLATLRFIQQRYNLVTFKLFNYSYTGGAHGMHFTSYFVVDLLSQTQINLTNLLLPGKQPQLLEALLEAYTDYDAELAKGWFNSKEEALAAVLTSNFFFNEKGLNFVYAPYSLAPYAYGEVVLTLPYFKLADLINPKYLLENN